MRSRAAILLLLSFCAIFAERARAQLWTYRESPSPNNLRGIAFTDSLNGIIVGDNGTLLRTSDGGAEWTATPTGTTEQLLAVSLLPDGNGLIVGSKGLILRTTDAFGTWTVQTSGTLGFLLAVACFDSLNAFAVGTSGIVLHTTNAGATWTKQTSGTLAPLHSVVFRNDSSAVAVGSFGALLQTTNGGSSWSLASLPYHGALNAVAFFDELNGFIAGDGGNGFRTTDGGAAWWPVAVPARFVSLPRFGASTAAAVGNGLSLTDTKAAFWSQEYVPSQLESASFRDAHTLFAVGLHGFFSACLLDQPDAPAVTLESPADAAEVAMLMTESVQLGVALRWRGYDAFMPSALRLQIGGDSALAGDLHYDGPAGGPALAETTTIIRDLSPEKPYYWHMRAEFGARVSPWSETRLFIPSAGSRAVSVRQIQEVTGDSLLLADSIQSSDPSRAGLQGSRLRDSVIVVVGVCTAAGSELRSLTSIEDEFSANSWFMLADTSADSSAAWSGMRVDDNLINRPRDIPVFWRARVGDVVMLTGKVREDPAAEMDSETFLGCFTVRLLDSGRAVPPTKRVSLSDLYHGSLPEGTVRYSTGERHEGTPIELVGLSVYAADNGAAGTVTLIDGGGNTITTSDLSRWFTLRDHRSPASTYAPPPLGAQIDTLRGFVTAEGGRYRIMPVRPGDMVFGAGRTGMISGTLYDDHNQNGVPDPGEPPMPGWRINFDGRVRTALLTDDLGRYSLAGLDSGWYTLTREPRFGWAQSSPDSGARLVHLGLNDTSGGNDFGLYFQWNTLAGRVYHDLNEDGDADSLEPGLAGWRVRLVGETVDSADTDADGNYFFPYVKTGLHYLNVVLEPLWEETIPVYFRGYQFDLREFNLHKTGYDFSVHPTPMRVKAGLTVRNNIGTSRMLWFGVRPGATYGMWGVDPLSTTIDYSEGESEIPPVSPGIFDARFIDPRGSDGRFGEGGWTDVRDFLSPSQADSYRVAFLPGYFFGGNYPMTIRWSHEWVSTVYSGTVLMIDDHGTITDMTSADSIVITDPAVESVIILAAGPQLTLAGAGPEKALPTRYRLAQNYPNPFNPVTAFEIDLPAAGYVRLSVYDILGREVAVLVAGEFPAGVLRASWDATRSPSGVYFCRVTAGTFTDTKKMLLLR